MYIKPSLRKPIYGIIFLNVLFFVLFSWYQYEEKEDVIALTKLEIARQESRLTALLEVIGRDGADEVVEGIIEDCSQENRSKFDTQLGRLPELKGPELIEMGQLFEACGNFFAQRSAVMVARLEREFEVHLKYIEILDAIDPHDTVDAYDLPTWSTLVALEVERSKLSTKLVDIQGKIIEDLRNNVPISADSMQTTLVDGQKTKEELIALSSRINTLRQEVLDL
jgi:hypothetical protein